MEEEKQKELFIAVTELFMKYGIKSLTMDDIARQLSISKKTLYLYVSDKKDLVKKCIEMAINEDECVMCETLEEHENAIDELMAINKRLSEKLQTIQPAVMFDLQKYYPEAWKLMEDHKQCFVFEMVMKNINTGINQGLYRENANPEIIASIYITLINKIFDSELFPAHKYSFTSLHKEIARYHIRGIASEKGIKYLVKQLKENTHDF